MNFVWEIQCNWINRGINLAVGNMREDLWLPLALFIFLPGEAFWSDPILKFKPRNVNFTWYQSLCLSPFFWEKAFQCHFHIDLVRTRRKIDDDTLPSRGFFKNCIARVENTRQAVFKFTKIHKYFWPQGLMTRGVTYSVNMSRQNIIVVIYKSRGRKKVSRARRRRRFKKPPTPSGYRLCIRPPERARRWMGRQMSSSGLSSRCMAFFFFFFVCSKEPESRV